MNRLIVPICALALVGAPDALAQRKVVLKHLKHIVLDPGHGGDNKGTAGAHGVYEKLLTLPIALELEKLLLRRTTARVTLTRRADVSLGLRERTHLANAAKADLFLSIHLNSSPRAEAHGLEVYFLSLEAADEEIARIVAREDGAEQHPVAAAPSTSPAPLGVEQILRDARMHGAHRDAERVADAVLQSLHRTLRAPRRGVFQAPFGVLKAAEMPAVVAEVGFLSHAEEGKKLLKAAYRKKIARALFEAIVALDKTLVRR